jgi:hypothetical protein
MRSTLDTRASKSPHARSNARRTVKAESSSAALAHTLTSRVNGTQ